MTHVPRAPVLGVRLGTGGAMGIEFWGVGRDGGRV